MRTGELESAAATAAAMSAPSAAAAAAEDAAGKVAGGDGERVLRRSVASLQANLEVRVTQITGIIRLYILVSSTWLPPQYKFDESPPHIPPHHNFFSSS